MLIFWHVSTLFNFLCLVVSTLINHTCHITHIDWEIIFSVWRFFPPLSPCWFFICGGKWRKPIIHSTVQSYIWHARLRSDTRRVKGLDHWVRFWGGRLATSSLQCRTAFLRRCLVLYRPNMSEFMWNLFETPEEKHMHSSTIKLISNAHKIHVGGLNKTHFNLQTVIFSFRSSTLLFCCAVSRVIKSHTAPPHLGGLYGRTEDASALGIIIVVGSSACSLG